MYLPWPIAGFWNSLFQLAVRIVGTHNVCLSQVKRPEADRAEKKKWSNVATQTQLHHHHLLWSEGGWRDGTWAACRVCSKNSKSFQLKRKINIMFARTLFCFPKIHTLDSNIFTSVMNSIVLQFKEKVDDKSNFLEKEEQQIFWQFIIIWRLDHGLAAETSHWTSNYPKPL